MAASSKIGAAAPTRASGAGGYEAGVTPRMFGTPRQAGGPEGPPASAGSFPVTAPVDAGPRYEDDYLGWAEHQAALLSAGRLSAVDAANIAEELGDMGRSEVRELESALRVLVMHMLKWDTQPERRSASWAGSIREQRRRIAKMIKRSPSLAPHRDEALADSYETARDWAKLETRLTEDDFPRDCPYGWADVVDRPFELDGFEIDHG